MDNLWKLDDGLYTHEENKRTYNYGNNKIYVTREDPYGFWNVTIDKGTLPDHLQHAIYTEFPLAHRDVMHYLQTRRKVLVKPE